MRAKSAKKWISVILAMAVLVAAAPLAGFVGQELFPTASAAEIVDSGKCGDNVSWTLDSDGVLTISGTGKMSDWAPDSFPPYSSSPFVSLNGIKAAVINSGVTSIGRHAFFNCTELKSVTIPESVTYIGKLAFEDCTSLTNVTIGTNVSKIGDSAFSGCTELTVLEVAEGNPIYHSDGNCLIETQSKTLIAGCKTSVISADGSVTSIGDSAFCGCTGLTSVTIPDSVTDIGYDAFSECTDLINVTIPNSVKSIKSGAFSGCTRLISITIPDGMTSIEDYTFFDCTSVTSVTIPDSVISIGISAFFGCTGLKNVTIPISVEHIAWGAFEECTGLKDVYYGGSEAMWKQVDVADGNEPLLGATIHFAQESTGGLRGDANLDGKVLANDARLVLRASAKLETLEGQGFVNCDLNGDGKLLAGEARKILRYSAKLESEL